MNALLSGRFNVFTNSALLVVTPKSIGGGRIGIQITSPSLHGFSDLLRFQTWRRIDYQELRGGALVPLDVVKLQETCQGGLRIQVKKIDSALSSLKRVTFESNCYEQAY